MSRKQINIEIDPPVSPVNVGDTFVYAGAPYAESAQWDRVNVKRTDTGQVDTWSLKGVGMVLARPDYYK